MFKKFCNLRALSLLNKFNISPSRVITIGNRYPFLFKGDNFPYFYGLYYCSGMIVIPKSGFNDNSVAIACHIESIENSIDSYNIPSLLNYVSEKNDDDVDVVVVSRSYLSSNALANYSNLNVDNIKKALLSSGLAQENIVEKYCGYSSFFFSHNFSSNQIVDVNYSSQFFLNHLFKDRNPNSLLINNKPNSLFEPSNALSLSCKSNNIVNSLPMNSYNVVKKGSQLNVSNLYNCVAGLVRSSDGAHFSLFHVNSFFDKPAAFKCINNSILELRSLDENDCDELMVDLYSIADLSSETSLLNSISVVSALRENGVRNENIRLISGSRSEIFSRGDEIIERPMFESFFSR